MVLFAAVRSKEREIDRRAQARAYERSRVAAAAEMRRYAFYTLPFLRCRRL